ncbi:MULTISPECIES: hypothetical protein [Rhodococcus]|uniref:hypothetical protein n=1 Tax=Rhodococcus TaxID=1827 RepID=UPI0012B55B11|nr:hypothetical protein [Rhodococcus sp. AQ5-07]
MMSIRRNLGRGVGFASVALATYICIFFASSARAAGPTIEINESGSTVTARILEIPENLPCAMVAWDGARYSEADLDSSEKAESFNDQALTTPNPQFIFTNSNESTMEIEFPLPGKFVIAVGCTSLEDGTDTVYSTKAITIRQNGTGSINTGSFGS